MFQSKTRSNQRYSRRPRNISLCVERLHDIAVRVELGELVLDIYESARVVRCEGRHLHLGVNEDGAADGNIRREREDSTRAGKALYGAANKACAREQAACGLGGADAGAQRRETGGSRLGARARAATRRCSEAAVTTRP